MKKLKLCLYLTIISVLQTPIVFADVIDVNTKFTGKNIGKQTHYLVDSSLKLTYEEAKQLAKKEKYARSSSDSKGFGVGRNSLWMFFDIKTSDDAMRTLYLVSQIPLYEAILFYEKDGELVEKKSGFKHPHSRWDISHNRVVFSIDLPPTGSERRYFIRIETDGVLAFDWVMGNFSETNRIMTREKFMLGAFLGLIAIMVCYNLFLFLSIREISYLYYVLYLVCFFMLTFGVDGLSFEYLWPESVEWNLRSFTFFAALSSIFSTLFAWSFLKLSKLSKLVNWSALVLIGVCTIHWVLCIFLSIDSNNERGNILGAIQLLSLVFFGAYSLANGQKQARFFLLAIIFLSTASTCYILSNLNVIESSIFSKYGLHIGASLEILFFSLALADRINIEKQKKLRAQKEAISAMQKSEKIKDEIIANTSHELLTPLTGITGISESLIEGALGQLDNNIVDNLKIIMSSSKRLTTQVHDILDLSKIKNNKVSINRKEILLNQIINDCIALLSPLVKNSGVRMVNDLRSNIIVFADHDRMYQIFNNLIGNAIKFTRKGEIRISAVLCDEHVEIKISDTGIGIDSTNLERIFEAFEQADGSISRSFGGSGLGLATTKKLIELQNGKIWVHSEVGRGSEFIFTLPKVMGHSASEVEENKPSNHDAVKAATQNLLIDSLSPDDYEAGSANDTKEAKLISLGKNLLKDELKGAKILAVDDEPINLQVIENIMQLEDVDLRLVNDPTIVIDEILSQWIPDIILLDVMMPRMDGYKLTRSLRKIYNESQLPIILLTAKNQINDLLEGFKSGANDYITKPFSRKEFMARINTQLELKALHNQLEQLVKSRTRELTKALRKQKELQKQLVESEKMASLGGLVAGVAHEINTPLGISITASSGIKSETNTIKSIGTKSLKRSQLENYFDEVNTSSLILVRNLDRIKETIDKFKQLAVSFYSDKPHEVELNKVLGELKRLLESKYNTNLFKLSISCEQMRIFSFEHEIIQVIMQLFENSIDHNHQKDHISISINVKAEQAGMVTVIFEDDGEGIPKDVREQIFEPFFTGKRLDGHIGLGLNLVYNLVAHKLGGSISCESEENKFCRFIINIPTDVHQELKYA